MKPYDELSESEKKAAAIAFKEKLEAILPEGMHMIVLLTAKGASGKCAVFSTLPYRSPNNPNTVDELRNAADKVENGELDWST